MELSIVNFLTGSSVVAVLLIQALKKLIKESIEPRFSDITIQISLFVLSLVLAFIGFRAGKLSADVIASANKIFTEATLIYVILVKSIFNKVIKGKTQ